MTDIEQTARNFTATGLRNIISKYEGDLALLDALDAEHGAVGREFRQLSRELAKASIEHVRAALALKAEQ